VVSAVSRAVDNARVSDKISVVLVEDEPLVRTWVRRLLEREGFAVLAEAADAEAAIDMALREEPDICLVDIGIPGGGIHTTREVARKLPETAIVMLTASSDHADLIDAIRAGAAGYLLKGMDPERIVHALHGVLEGEAAIPRPLMAHLIKDLQTQGRHRTIVGRRGRVDLTSREWEVLELLCEGLNTSTIAGRLSISPVTVRRHSSAIVRKLGVSDRTELVALVRERL
jgi:two-component system, NarL family, nitrate/nitrite response regulator NarL